MNEEDLVRLYQRGAIRRDANRADCASPEALVAVVERRGSESERLGTINHAMVCPDCSEELELLRSTGIVRDRGRIPRFGFALAASIVVVAGLGYYTVARSRSADSGEDLMRDGTGDVQLVSPLSASSQRLDSLVWRPVAGAASYVIDIRRDDGTLLTRGTTSDTTFVVPDSARIEPGSEVYWGVTARLSDGTELRSVARRVRITTP